MKPIKNIAAYRFVSLDRLVERRKQLRTWCKDLFLSGTILLSSEGINLFLAGGEESVDEFLARLRSDAAFEELEVKASYSDTIPFRRLLVKIKPEIIAFEPAGLGPREGAAPKLPARQLKEWLDEGRPVRLLDVRNDYEVKLGTFRNAVPIGVGHFRDFASQVVQLPEEWKDEPVVMFCTGGIRCEKAGPYLEQRGFRQVYQLDGGILKYFEECGDAHYDGDCFVFDQRVALDSQLRETDTALCFACQMPLTVEEQASPQYVPEKSCPHCYRSPDETMQQAIARREETLRALADPLPGSQPYENRRPVVVPQRLDGVTARELMTTLFTHVEAPVWDEVFAAGRVQRLGESLNPDAVVHAGERIENLVPGTVEPDVNAAIEIVHEDEALVIVNKPAPLPMHPCGRFNRHTLIYLLNEVYRPQVLRVAHRLDANTTGVVVLSRTRHVAGQVQPQFERCEVEKRYLVQVAGHPEEDAFDCGASIGAIAQRLGAREVKEGGLTSLTRFRVLQRREDGTSYLEARPITGRTNQIRLHLAHLGLPVLGDPIYGEGVDPTAMPTLAVGDPPLRLHAWRVTLWHPLERRHRTFHARPPAWFEAPLT